MLEKPPLSDPPRDVPTSLRVRVLLGGLSPVIGWLLTAFGGFMATLFVGNSEWVTAYEFSGELATTTGKVTAAQATNARVNSERVFAVTFDYTVDGRLLRGTSYSQATAPAVGGDVTVEFVVAAPEIARIEGGRTRVFPLAIGFVGILPLIGLCLLLVGWTRNRRLVRLMRDGRSAWGVLTGHQRTASRINSQPVHRLEFTYVDDHGQRRIAHARSHHREFLDAGMARHVLFDPATDDSCVVELLPGRPTLSDGGWLPASSGQLARVLALPAAAVLLIALASYIEL